MISREFVRSQMVPASLGALLGALGCLISVLWPVRGPFGLDFVIGSAIAYFYLQLDRNSWGPYLAIAIIAGSTWALWGHPYAAIILCLEFGCVALLMQRLSPLAIMALFWMSVGPLLVGLFYGQMLHMSQDIWFIVAIKQAMNGLLCVATGTFLATFVRLTFSNRSFIRPISVIGFATSGVMPFVLIPTILITFESARQQSETQLALHAVAWAQMADHLGDGVAADGRLPTSAELAAAIRAQGGQREDFGNFTPMHIEVFDDQGRVVSACLPSCPVEGANEAGGDGDIRIHDLPSTTVYLPQGGSLMQRWRDGSLTTVLPAETGRPRIRATTSLRSMVDRSFRDVRSDFYLLISVVSVILAVGVILYSRVVQPFRRMAEALDGWHSYDFTVPQLPEQKFVEIERFRLLIDRVSKSLTRERDRSMELQEQLNTIACQSPMIFASWLILRRHGAPILQYISARPEERLLVPSDLFTDPVKALSRVHPEDRAVLRAMLAQLVEGGHGGSEVRVMGVDGEWRWILCGLSSRRTAAGLDETIGVFTDITELNSMRQMLGQNKGITLVGRMVAGLAHELNQPLNVISMAADNLLHYLNRHADALEAQLPYLRDKSEKIMAQVRRAGSLLGTVEGLANQGASSDGRHDLGTLLDESLRAVAELAEAGGVTITSRLPDGPLPVRGGREALINSFVAILRNAIEAIGDAGMPAGVKGNVTVTVTRFSKISRMKIEFTDNGRGIDPEILPFLFSPFQSIKATAEGAGLSLARCFSVIQASGGEVYARNNPIGATITIYLPLG